MINPRRRKILIYAAVPREEMLGQGFYAAEAEGLRNHPDVGEVRLTNRLDEVARRNYDGLVSFFYSSSAAACLLGRLIGRPAIATGGAEQVFPELAENRWRQFIRIAAFRLTVLFARRILATSTSDLVQMRRLLWFGHHKLTLSFHGAAAVEQPFAVASADRPEGSFITICGMDSQANILRKGLPEALKLLAIAAAEYPGAYLTVIGRTTCKSFVDDMAHELGVSDHLRFAGYVTEEHKLHLLRTHRYYVQLSIYEGFGIGALEAIAQGCQVIHSGAGGLADTVADYGVIIPRDRIESFTFAGLPSYGSEKQEALKMHLARFRPALRADAILNALFKG